MVSKGYRPEDDGIDFDEDNEVKIPMPSIIELFFFFFFKLHVYSVNG